MEENDKTIEKFSAATSIEVFHNLYKQTRFLNNNKNFTRYCINLHVQFLGAAGSKANQAGPGRQKERMTLTAK